jgi:hypothetical protein
MQDAMTFPGSVLPAMARLSVSSQLLVRLQLLISL